MLAALFVVLPAFGLIATGYLARATRLVGERTGEGLSDFVFVLAVPCLLFRTLAKAEIPAVQPWGYWIAYFTGLGVVWVLAMLIASRGFGRKGPELVVSGFAAGQSNTVLVGIPIIVKAYGEAGAVPLALLLAVHLPVTMTLATVLAEGRNASPLAILRKLITHPIIVGILLGSLARPFVTHVPEPFWAIIDGLAGAAIPCALVSLGIAMHRYGLKSGIALPAILSGLKLGLHPAIVLVLATQVFTMPPAWAGVAVLFAACPCGINAYLFAERYKQGAGDASTAIALSTALAIVTMTLWLSLLGRTQ
jgi:malonate transporter and related proteins